MILKFLTNFIRNAAPAKPSVSKNCPDMIERVARALCLSDGLNPMERLEIAGEVFFRWEINQPRALAVMAEMRMPTMEMIEAGMREYVIDPDSPDKEVERIWQSMADAAGTGLQIEVDYLDRTRRVLRSDQPYGDA